MRGQMSHELLVETMLFALCDSEVPIANRFNLRDLYP